MHDLTRNEVSHSQSDHIDGTIDVSDDPPRPRTGQPVCFGTQTQHNLVAISIASTSK
jgi:hypothetical protein